jgi:hypothetical protein
MENPKDVSLDDTRVSDFTGFSQINNSGATMWSYGAGVPNNNNNGRGSPLEQHIENTRGQNVVENSPRQSYNNASHASTEKDAVFANDGVDLFFDQSQTQKAIANRETMTQAQVWVRRIKSLLILYRRLTDHAPLSSKVFVNARGGIQSRRDT